MTETKHVVMMSSGAGSAGAAKRVAERYGTDNLVLLFADVNGEHGDNYRFLREASEWVGGELVVIDNGGQTIWQVFAKAKFLGNNRIDPCSRVLKREPMRKWLENHCDPEHTISYLGFDWTEEHRWIRAQGHWAPWKVECSLGMPNDPTWPDLIDKEQVMQWLASAGILPPLLTRQGFPHANCGGGCVKAGIKQFTKLLDVAPETYAEWEWNEQRMRKQLGDVAILTDRRKITCSDCGGSGEGWFFYEREEEPSDARCGTCNGTGTVPNRRPLPLSELRIRIQDESKLDCGGAEEEWGACNCFTPIEGDEEVAA